MSGTSGAQQRKNVDYAPLVGIFRGSTEKKCRLRPLVRIFRGSTEKKCRLRPACRNLPGLNREKTRISPRLSESSGAQQRKNVDFAPLVGIFRGSAEKKHELRPACRNLPGLSREKTRITPRLSESSGAQQRKNVDYKAFRNVGYNKCRDAHRGRMFRLLWTFVDLKLPSAMSHAIHKIVSIKRCQSYFISRRSPHLGISKDSELCASAHRCLHYAYARLIARVTFYLQYLCPIHGQLEGCLQHFRCALTHHHTPKEYFKILIHTADLRINLQIQ